MYKRAKKKNKNRKKGETISFFTYDLLIALNNWQNGWRENQERRREVADVLVEQCRNLPEKFKQADMPCYRKRFLLEGEIVPIALKGHLAEGIASWTTSLKYAMDFKDLYKENTKFAVVFKHIPEKAEVIVNIASLWKNRTFIKAAEKFRKEHPNESVAIFNFRDKQSEIVLRSTLKGNEIEDIVGISHSFDELCDMANIPEDQREDISKWHAKNPNAIPIEERVFAGSKATKRAVAVAITKMKAMIEDANLNNIPLIWPKDLVHINDLKHMPK